LFLQLLLQGQFYLKDLIAHFCLLYRPHLPNNVESWQVFPDDEGICAFLQNDLYKPKEIISLEDNKIPKGLTPLESSFSMSDVGKKKR
jgi:hypothetical protein